MVTHINKRLNTRLMQVGVLLFLIVVSLMGCGGVSGRLVYDDKVDQLFKSLTVLPDHRYYFTGSDSYPTAIIGIDEKYTLSTKFWKPVDMTEKQLKRWVITNSRRAYYDSNHYGRYILDDKGQRLGVWYSLKNWRDFASVRILDERTVQVSTPFDSVPRYRRPRIHLNNYHDFP